MQVSNNFAARPLVRFKSATPDVPEEEPEELEIAEESQTTPAVAASPINSNRTPKSAKKDNHAVEYGALGLSLVALGVTGFVMHRNGSLKKMLNKLSGAMQTPDKVGVGGLQEGEKLSKDMVKYLEDLANNKIYNKRTEPLKLREGRTKPFVLRITAEDEFATKNGGLAEVPSQMHEACKKEGIADGAIISPLYNIPGKSGLVQENGKYFYWSSQGNKKVEVQKLVSYKVDVCMNGEKKVLDTDVFYSAEHGRMFISNKESFDDVYSYDYKLEEPVRFGGVFCKSVYTLLKIIEDPDNLKSIKMPVITDEAKETLKKLRPDVLSLNDWHVAAMSVLTRILSKIEAETGTISKDMANILADCPTEILLHNEMFQGFSAHIADLMNTWFGKYSKDVCDKAVIKWNDGKPAEKAFIAGEMKDRLNLLKLAGAYSDMVVPVSETYAKEISNSLAKGELNHIWNQRYGQQTLVGIVNGNDREKWELSAKSVEKLKKAFGIEYVPYTHADSIEKIMSARAENKKRFIEIFKKWLETGKLGNGKAFNIINKDYVNLSDLNANNIGDVPILAYWARVCEQKGFHIAGEAIEKLLDEWEQKYPGRQKPLIIIGGPKEDAKYTKALVDLGDKLKEKGARVVIVDGFVPGPTLTPVIDSFIESSLWEPCGLPQGEVYAAGGAFIGTPVGGHCDTVDEGITGFLSEKVDVPSFKAAVGKYLDIFYNDKQKLQNMVRACIDKDMSWLIKTPEGKLKGAAVQYLKLFGWKDDKFAA